MKEESLNKTKRQVKKPQTPNKQKVMIITDAAAYGKLAYRI